MTGLSNFCSHIHLPHQHINSVRHGNPITNGNHANNVEWSGSFGLKSFANVTITRNPQNQLKLIYANTLTIVWTTFLKQ